MYKRQVIGLLIFLAASFLLRQVGELRRPDTKDSSAVVLIFIVAAGPFTLWIGLALFATWIDQGIISALAEIGGRSILVVPGLFLVALGGFSAFQRVKFNLTPAVAFPLILTALAIYLLIGAELFYVVDQFSGGFRRMNTVFKTYYQAWLLLGISSAYGLYYLWSIRPLATRPSVLAKLTTSARVTWIGVAILLLVASFYYPVGAILSRTGIHQAQHAISDNTLDGLAFLQEDSPGEYAAIRWLRDEAPWGRIVEAIGDDYSDFGRISSSTGLPTVLGWKGHELQWRNSSLLFDNREDDVRTIYSTSNSSDVLRLLIDYDIRYIYLGSRERTTYGGEHLTGSERFLDTVFEQDGVIIYEVVQ